jgi:hypothetical protein
MNSSSYASTDFQFFKGDFSFEGPKNDLLMKEKNFDGDDNLYIYDHFTGSGRIEYIKFSDKTLSGSNLPLTP